MRTSLCRCPSREGSGGIHPLARSLRRRGQLQCGHAGERRAPREQALRTNADCQGQLVAPRLDRLDLLRLPEDQVDRVERCVAEARGRVDSDESALLAAVEDVAWGEVAVQEDGWRGMGREPRREPAT